jgi:NADH dehydrogenase
VSRHRVVVIGAGFGGLATVRGLRTAPVDITLVDAHNFHTFQPLLYQVATAGLDADDVGYAVRGILRRQHNAAVRMGRVVGIDVDQRIVHTTNGPPIGYDTLVVAAGAVSNSFGIPGVEQFAYPLKWIEDAVDLRNHLLTLFEKTAGDPSAALPGALDVVVCGGGPTGVEMAGGLLELYGAVLTKDFPNLDVSGARITLVEAGPRLLGAFTEHSGARARRTLERRGVHVVTGVGVQHMEADAVVLADGRRLVAQTIVWAAGVRANPLAQMLGVPLTRAGRIVVKPDLSVEARPEIFAVGDIAADPHVPLPQVAQPAIQGGHHVAAQIRHRLEGRATQPFRYWDKGSMATIGRHDAVAEFPNGWRLSGPLGWLAWLGLHILYLMGFRNRLNVLVNWAWNYVTYDRGARLLAEGDVSDRRKGQAGH